jgi:Mg2+-importing ATPase
VPLGTAGNGADLAGPVHCRRAGSRGSQPTGSRRHRNRRIRRTRPGPAGFLVFLDQPKADAADALRRLAELAITVKLATGDNPLVAEKVCADLGLRSGGTLTSADIDALDDGTLAAAAESATIFARISPEQKARLIRLLRRRGRAVGFLGDGVNDALALHAAHVGLSVDTATDVAKDAADVLLLEKDLDVLAGGVARAGGSSPTPSSTC